MNPVEKWREDIAHKIRSWGVYMGIAWEATAMRASAIVEAADIPSEVEELVVALRQARVREHITCLTDLGNGEHTDDCRKYREVLAKWEGKGDG